MRQSSLIWNWKRVLIYGWSVRLGALSVVLQIADGVLPYFQDVVPEGPFRWASVLVGAGAIFARIIPQRKVTDG